MISVIVIGKNEGARLAACLNSVRAALDSLLHEVIYVDSHSTDGSAALARSLGARCFLLSDARTTAGLGRLVGTQNAKGEYLLFLDGDMQLCPGFVQRAMMAMAQKDYDGVCGIREDRYVQGEKVVSRNPNYFGCTQERIAPEFGGALFIKKDALTACGGWSVDTVACEEAELYARLKATGARVAEIPVPMIVHTDVMRDNRGVWGTVFSRRRLGEGQAMRCAAAAHRGSAYLAHEREKFDFYLLDILSLLALLVLGPAGLIAACPLQCVQLGYLLARKRPRAFVSQKLFFFAFPLGLVTYRVRSRDYTVLD